MGYPGKRILECVRNADIHEAVEKALQGRPQEKETVIYGGEPKSLLIRVAPLKQESGLSGTVSVVNDLTAIRRLENARKEFVANVSHELKTPLTNIRGYAETLRNGAMADPIAAPRFLEKIESNAVQLQKLVEDILKLSEIESGRLELCLQPVFLPDFIDSLAEEYRDRAKMKKLSLESKIPRDIPRMMADSSALAQILGNLLDNAIRYTETGGVTIRAAQKENDVEITVSDTGIGIASSDRDRIFERFYRADKARTRGNGGTGLGLSIVKHLANAHGGKIEVASEPGFGSEFKITFPIGT